MVVEARQVDRIAGERPRMQHRHGRRKRLTRPGDDFVKPYVAALLERAEVVGVLDIEAADDVRSLLGAHQVEMDDDVARAERFEDAQMPLCSESC